jgi:hypothetical protein
MWRSVRQAIGILVGGNIGEIGFTLFGTLVTGTSPLTARQLLLVNLLTDLAPALAIALRSPPEEASQGLLAEGPDTSLGTALTDEIAVRAVATGAAASGAWLAARLTGRAARARTVGLAALVGTELGQTLLVGGRSPAVVAASLVSTSVLVGIVQTPGISQFFGCTPLGPVGWVIAGGSSLAGSVGSLLLPRLGQSLMPKVNWLASSAATGRAGQLVAELRGHVGTTAPAGTSATPPPAVTSADGQTSAVVTPRSGSPPPAPAAQRKSARNRAASRSKDSGQGLVVAPPGRASSASARSRAPARAQ